ncbi:MAG TPA: IS4 family transposase [Clostridia bacterium]|nr:IS4 family transposase [Clostridia bacterium]
MSKETRKIKRNLDAIIRQMVKNKGNFVKNPEKDFTHKRKLSLKSTLNFLLSMGGKSLSCELLEHFNYSADAATSSALIQQRNKINESALPFLFRKFTNTVSNFKSHKGYRILATDGSALNISANPQDEDTYFQSNPDSKGYNQLHLNTIYDLCNKLYTDILIQPRRKMNENRALVDIIDRSSFSEKTIIIGDRGYESYNAFAHIEQKGYKYAIRIKDVNSSGILRGLELPKTGEFDTQIDIKLTRRQTNEIKENPNIYRFLPSNSTFDYLERKSKEIYSISFRVVRFEITPGKYECIATNLENDEFSPAEIKQLYRMRWGIETSFRELKYSIGLVNLHSKKAELVEQEIYARFIMYNFCSLVVRAVAIKQKSTKFAYKANFTMAVQVCKSLLKRKISCDKVDPLIQKYILPIRENRTNVRNVSAKSFVCFNYRVA